MDKKLDEMNSRMDKLSTDYLTFYNSNKRDYGNLEARVTDKIKKFELQFETRVTEEYVKKLHENL